MGKQDSLYIDKEHVICVEDESDFLDHFKPLAEAMKKSLIKQKKNVEENIF